MTAEPAIKARSKITVLICTRNEAENLPRVLPKIPEWVHEILIVDGHSTDGTVELAKHLCPRARILPQPGKGKSEALCYGVQQATGDIVITLDADGETDPEDIPRFVEPLLNGYDFAKGSRFTSGWANKPWSRIFGNWLIIRVFNVLYGTNYTDLCSGYNAFWKEATQRTELWNVNGWLYEPRIISRALRARLRVVEVPQHYVGRSEGDSKLPNWPQGLSAIWFILLERFRPGGTRHR